MNAPAEGKYANVNGLKMYCEIHGTGRPLVLLHGAFGIATVYPALAKDRQVIALFPPIAAFLDAPLPADRGQAVQPPEGSKP
jgi:hypothetical protein